MLTSLLSSLLFFLFLSLLVSFQFSDPSKKVQPLLPLLSHPGEKRADYRVSKLFLLLLLCLSLSCNKISS